MTLNDAIIKCPRTGVCTIDVDLAIKLWTNKCVISRWHDTFRMYRIRNKRAIALKVTISRSDAIKLRRALGLVNIPSGIFRNASEYRLPNKTRD